MVGCMIQKLMVVSSWRVLLRIVMIISITGLKRDINVLCVKMISGLGKTQVKIINACSVLVRMMLYMLNLLLLTNLVILLIL